MHFNLRSCVDLITNAICNLAAFTCVFFPWDRFILIVCSKALKENLKRTETKRIDSIEYIEDGYEKRMNVTCRVIE